MCKVVPCPTIRSSYNSICLRCKIIDGRLFANCYWNGTAVHNCPFLFQRLNHNEELESALTMNEDLLLISLLKIILIFVMSVPLPTINARKLDSIVLPNNIRPKRSPDLLTESEDHSHSQNRHRHHRAHADVESLLNSAVSSSEPGYATVVREDGKLPAFRKYC